MFLVSLKVSTGSNLEVDTSSFFKKKGLGSLKDSCCVVCGTGADIVFFYGAVFSVIYLI